MVIYFTIFFIIDRHRSLPEVLNVSPNFLREDIKRLKLIELQLRDEIKTLSHQRDGLVMELQQLQEAKPVLEKAYAVSIFVKSLLPTYNKYILAFTLFTAINTS